ncbi:hypothetical protein [Azospirillum isscasi]|uniref:DUF4131 domain-containing protein n=1 Tax=Azospirillum isscasi TaxID=3053926 RepID=A0ABU0WIV7_9PROT|nr:hypothetical protein [Azospirillum isscasi]MDQ2104151.1 hypothetical protein [Azospirillum isscasi]
MVYGINIDLGAYPDGKTEKLLVAIGSIVAKMGFSANIDGKKVSILYGNTEENIAVPGDKLMRLADGIKEMLPNATITIIKREYPMEPVSGYRKFTMCNLFEFIRYSFAYKDKKNSLLPIAKSFYLYVSYFLGSFGKSSVGYFLVRIGIGVAVGAVISAIPPLLRLVLFVLDYALYAGAIASGLLAIFKFRKHGAIQGGAFAAIGVMCILLQGYVHNNRLTIPNKTEITIEQYVTLCSSSSLFDVNSCSGKRVLWDAKVSSIVDSSTLRVDVGGRGFDLHYYGDIPKNVAYPQVYFTFAGTISKKGWVYDDIIDVKNATIIKSVSDAKAIEMEEKIKNEEKKLNEEKSDANAMGVSLEDYRFAKSNIYSAHSACQQALLSMARWKGGSTNWLPNFSWRTDGQRITVEGSDVTLKNGFGAEKSVHYECSYSISGKNAVIYSAD